MPKELGSDALIFANAAKANVCLLSQKDSMANPRILNGHWQWNYLFQRVLGTSTFLFQTAHVLDVYSLHIFV